MNDTTKATECSNCRSNATHYYSVQGVPVAICRAHVPAGRTAKPLGPSQRAAVGAGRKYGTGLGWSR